MLNDREEYRATHGGQNKESREAHVVFQEIGEVIVVEDDQEESDDGDEDDEDQGVQERSFELLGSGVRWGLEVDEIGCCANGNGGRRKGVGRREGIDQEDYQKHAD